MDVGDGDASRAHSLVTVTEAALEPGAGRGRVWKLGAGLSRPELRTLNP